MIEKTIHRLMHRTKLMKEHDLSPEHKNCG